MKKRVSRAMASLYALSDDELGEVKDRRLNSANEHVRSALGIMRELTEDERAELTSRLTDMSGDNTAGRRQAKLIKDSIN